MDWLKRLLNHRPPSFPDDIWDTCTRHLSILQHLTDAERQKLKTVAEQLVSRIPVRGAAGFEPDDVCVMLIAAQAALPVLHLSLELYDDISAIVVYPSPFIVENRQIDPTGVTHESHVVLSGQAVNAGGAVLLNWSDIATQIAGNVEHNLVIHEFAHKIDMARGHANGYPRFLADVHKGLNAVDWHRAFSEAFGDFQRQASRAYRWANHALIDLNGNPIEIAQPPMDRYAAKNPAEFFAVATETFFITPERLYDAYPEVYRLLSKYYQQDTLRASTGHHWAPESSQA